MMQPYKGMDTYQVAYAKYLRTLDRRERGKERSRRENERRRAEHREAREWFALQGAWR